MHSLKCGQIPAVGDHAFVDMIKLKKAERYKKEEKEEKEEKEIEGERKTPKEEGADVKIVAMDFIIFYQYCSSTQFHSKCAIRVYA